MSIDYAAMFGLAVEYFDDGWSDHWVAEFTGYPLELVQGLREIYKKDLLPARAKASYARWNRETA